MKDFWGKGTPEYTKDDLLSPQDIYEFVLEPIFNVLLKEGYEIIDVSKKITSIPSCVIQKNNELFFVLIRVEVAPRKAGITNEDYTILLNQAEKFNATPMFAPAEIGSTDPIRFNKGLALKYDGFYVNYVGLTPLKYEKIN
jgi:hypothetical protein